MFVLFVFSTCFAHQLAISSCWTAVVYGDVIFARDVRRPPLPSQVPAELSPISKARTRNCVVLMEFFASEIEYVNRYRCNAIQFHFFFLQNFVGVLVDWR